MFFILSASSAIVPSDSQIILGATPSRMIASASGGLVCVLGLYMVISYFRSREDYNRMIPRIRRYQRGLKKMKKFYMIEDKQQRDFEKGEWRNGQ